MSTIINEETDKELFNFTPKKLSFMIKLPSEELEKTRKSIENNNLLVTINHITNTEFLVSISSVPESELTYIHTFVDCITFG